LQRAEPRVAILGREPRHREIEKRLAAVGGRLFVSLLVKFEASAALARQKAEGDERQAVA
jgi:hypothetical protein